MNKNQFEGKLNQVKGDAKIWLGKKTHNPKTEISGNVNKFQGNLQEKFGNGMAHYENAKNVFETRTDEVNKSIHSKWDKFTQEDIQEINGSFSKFSDKIKEKYNTSQQEANAQIRDFMSKF